MLFGITICRLVSYLGIVGILMWSLTRRSNRWLLVLLIGFMIGCITNAVHIIGEVFSNVAAINSMLNGEQKWLSFLSFTETLLFVIGSIWMAYLNMQKRLFDSAEEAGCE